METVRLCKHEPVTLIELWHPKYHEREAWVSLVKVKNANTHYIKIVFTKAKSEEFKGSWVISKRRALTYPRTTNGTITVLAIPLADLTLVDYAPHCIHEV